VAEHTQLSLDWGSEFVSKGGRDWWTVRGYGERWLEWRERAGFRSVAADRSRWRTHVLVAPWIDVPLCEVTRGDAERWRRVLLATKLRAQTIKNTINLVRGLFGAAVEEGILEGNPFGAMRLPRSRAARSDDTWTVLTPEEQERLLRAVAVPDRWLVGAALGTGLRRGELWSLHTDDVELESDEPHLVVRYGGSRRGKFQPTKGGRVRLVPLFGLGLLAVGAWMGGLSLYAPNNPRGLAFPTRRGCTRSNTPPWWGKVIPGSGLTRRVRWQDLRHSCASSLVAGWWGRRWSLEEVCALLGHRSRQTTERYAHWQGSALAVAARETEGAREQPREVVTMVSKGLVRGRMNQTTSPPWFARKGVFS
jgi:integrase